MDASRKSFRVLIYGLAGLSVLFLTLPTLVVLVTSINPSEVLSFPPKGFSLKWYLSLADIPELRETAWVSVKLAALTTIVCLVLGVAGALALARSTSPWAAAFEALVMSPLALPGLAIGLAILVFASAIGAGISFSVLLVSHIVICVPLVVRSTLSSLALLGTSYADASSSLGASRWYTFRHVTFPLIRTGAISGAFIAFLSSFDNLTVSLFLTDARNQVLPIQMWSMIENSLDIRVAAVSGLVVMFTAVMMILMERAAGLSRSLIKR